MMEKKKINNVKLGIFVTAGVLFLIVMLYMIGRDQNLFNANITLRARFSNAVGLVPGNNIRYAGIQVGTVKKVKLLNDTIVEVMMLVDKKYKPHIHKNALVNIGTEGLIGNKIVNIIPGKGIAPEVDDGDLLGAKKSVSTDDILETLSISNRNIAVISENLKVTVEKINGSTALWELLNDASLPRNIRASAENIRLATDKANLFVADLHAVIGDVKQGKGSLGQILKDTALASELGAALEKIKEVGLQADLLAADLRSLTKDIDANVNSGKGPVSMLLKDSTSANKISSSLRHIEQGTAAFNENMEALKHNFLFRGYFRKKAKEARTK
jgi:phospholipid/cholesterol/gamma-HCH transport system substrate-binding protein